MPNLIVSAVSTFDNKGLKKGKKEISAFEKQIKSFAKVFAAAFSVTALTRFGKAAVKAFAEDEKAARSLEQQLKNTGFQFSAPSVELYIANLQKTTGVIDDELRPAFQQLLTVTGSITTSQDALNTALNISAATGKSLTTITTALSRGYAGNTTGLSRLGAGLDKNLLKTGDMNKIMAELNTKFSGQAAARLETYAGKMSLLSVAAADAQEIIGKGILDALTLLGEDNTIEGLTNDMQDFATATSEVILGLAVIADKLKQLTTIPGLGSLFDVKNIPVLGGYIGGLQQLGRNAMQQQDRGGQERTAGRINAKQFILENKLSKAKALELNTLLKKNAIENKNVEELRKKFDLERIGLTAALNAATDDETKLRLRAQLAILDNNDALAKKILAEMDATKSLKELTSVTNLTIDYFSKLAQSLVGTTNYLGMTYQQILNERLRESGNIGLSPIIPRTSSNFPSLPSSYFENLGTKLEGNVNYAGMSASQITMERLRESGNRMPSVNVTVDASQSGDKLSQLVAEMLQVAQRSGFSTSANGSLP